MKTLMVVIAATMLSASVFAGGAGKNHPNKYCTRMENGKLVVVHEGKTLNSDVTLSNGTVIKTDGTVVKKDGTTTMLKEGECVDKDGTVMEENNKDNDNEQMNK